MFLLGLFGSGHCIGMCGPLIVALPGQYGRLWAHLVYHAGRILTYTLVGALLGGSGQGLIRLASVPADQAVAWTARVQIAVSLPVALFLLTIGMHRLGMLGEPAWLAKLMPRTLPGFGSAMRRVLDRRGGLRLFALGLMLGLLPCGLSYGAFARTLTAKGMGIGALWAALFGAGTLPGLLLLGTGAATLWRRFRAEADLLAGLIMIGMAVALLVEAWTAFF